MDETFDSAYIKNKHYFGNDADDLLKSYYELFDKGDKILEIGIGQGRNALFLLKKGFRLVGVDTSIVAIESLKKLAYKEKLDLELHNIDFNDFNTNEKQFSGIIIIGVIQVLSEKNIKELVKKSKLWLKDKGLIYLKGFTKKDESFKPNSSKWNKISNLSYKDDKNNYRTFLDIEDVMKFFKHFEIIYKWEGFGDKHRHNEGPLEQHHCFELILQKQ